jgi:hypothetical protein
LIGTPNRPHPRSNTLNPRKAPDNVDAGPAAMSYGRFLSNSRTPTSSDAGSYVQRPYVQQPDDKQTV